MTQLYIFELFEDCKFTNHPMCRSRWSSGVGGSGGGSSGRSSAGARDSRRQTRVIRTGRDRGSGLLGSQPQPVIPASVIPEELISQVCWQNLSYKGKRGR